MMRYAFALAAIITLAALGTVQPTAGQTVPPPVWLPLVADGRTAPCDCSGDLYNCSHFSTQPEAQTCHDHCMVWTGLDIHRLDANNDGVACESLPPGWAVWKAD